MPVRPAAMSLPDLRHARRIVRAEYREMPGLRLSVDQATRLWSLDRPLCEAVLDSLAEEGFLRRTPSGGYTRVA